MSGHSFFEEQGVAETSLRTSMGPNPYYQGLRIVDRDDLFPRGFTKVELDAVYAGLTQEVHDEGLILESPDLSEVEFYNPGSEPVSDDFILEAITVEQFSRTERRMAAVVKVLNRHLKESAITALPPVVGKPRKSGPYAYVIVQIPFSDGQTVHVVFHSPEGDKKKITANDTLIAFRWLLNKRDITHVVAPEDGEEVSLETIAKRVTQLVVKNSARFERQQKTAQAERQELETTRDAVRAAEDRQTELMDDVAGAVKQAEGIGDRLSNTLAQLEKQRTTNAELQAKIDALKQTQTSDNGGNTKNIDELFAEMVKEAARWRGAVMKVAKLVVNDKKKALAVNNITTKGDLDAYLIKKFKIDASAARDVSNWLSAKNIPDDKTAEIAEFADEEWAKMIPEKHSGVIMEIPITDTRPEEIRVILDKGLYLVQTRRNGEWITQKEHNSEAAAISDAEQWYPDANPPAQDVPPAYVRDLQDILDGKYDTATEKILDLLEKAIDTAERESQVEKYQSILNAASNRLTELLAKEAA